MTTTRAQDVATWLGEHPAPIRRTGLDAWADLVIAEIGSEALPALLDLLADGDDEQQYQAVAAARILGAEVWLQDDEPETYWLVTLPGEPKPRRIQACR